MPKNVHCSLPGSELTPSGNSWQFNIVELQWNNCQHPPVVVETRQVGIKHGALYVGMIYPHDPMYQWVDHG